MALLCDVRERNATVFVPGVHVFENAISKAFGCALHKTNGQRPLFGSPVFRCHDGERQAIERRYVKPDRTQRRRVRGIRRIQANGSFRGMNFDFIRQ